MFLMITHYSTSWLYLFFGLLNTLLSFRFICALFSQATNGHHYSLRDLKQSTHSAGLLISFP